MAISLSELMSVMQNGVQAINNLTTQISVTFPQASAVSTTSPSTGTIAFQSSRADGFLTVITSSGATFLVPLYNVP